MMRGLCLVLLLLTPSTARAGGKAGVGSGLPYGTPLFGAGLDIGRPGGFVLTYGIGFGDVNLEARVGAMLGLGWRF
jgi:hypothetical protein